MRRQNPPRRLSRRDAGSVITLAKDQIAGGRSSRWRWTRANSWSNTRASSSGFYPGADDKEDRQSGWFGSTLRYLHTTH